MEKQCISCKKPMLGLTGVAKFKCPKCMKYEIIRCAHCRQIAAKYICPGCKFEGPN
ncbi:MAG: zinc finger domain-containing protein [Candidatus Woesearchaeota archaeon]